LSYGTASARVKSADSNTLNTNGTLIHHKEDTSGGGVTLFSVFTPKGKDIPVTGRGGCERSRLPHYLDKRLTDGKVVIPTLRPPFTPRFLFEDSWYSFLLEAKSTPGS
jgi:hypothetical protein